VYPALAVAQALEVERERQPTGRVDIVYIGGVGGIEEGLVRRAGVRFVGIPAGGVHGIAPTRALQNLAKLMRGFGAVYRLGRRTRPDALLVTGGYASVPVALAAWMLRVPILVYLPDIEPGLAVQFVARLAARVAVTVEEAGAHFAPRKVLVTGYPVRAEFQDLDRTAARAALGLAPDEPVLLVMGGSRGARSINQALDEVLEPVLGMAQVVHVSGALDWPWVSERREGLPPALQARYRAFSYLHEIGPALASADLALCRAGAMTLGELPFFALPAILVPYPHAWRYQRVNAEWLAERGAAIWLADERLPETFLPTVRRLLSDRPALLEMSRRIAALARPDAASRLGDELFELSSLSSNLTGGDG